MARTTHIASVTIGLVCLSVPLVVRADLSESRNAVTSDTLDVKDGDAESDAPSRIMAAIASRSISTVDDFFVVLGGKWSDQDTLEECWGLYSRSITSPIHASDIAELTIAKRSSIEQFQATIRFRSDTHEKGGISHVEELHAVMQDRGKVIRHTRGISGETAGSTKTVSYDGNVVRQFTIESDRRRHAAISALRERLQLTLPNADVLWQCMLINSDSVGKTLPF